MSMRNLLDLKRVIYRAWGINLYQPDATSSIPGYIWRRMGAA